MFIQNTRCQVHAGGIYHPGVSRFQFFANLRYLTIFNKHITAFHDALLLVGPYRCILEQYILLYRFLTPAIGYKGKDYLAVCRLFTYPVLTVTATLSGSFLCQHFGAPGNP